MKNLLFVIALFSVSFNVNASTPLTDAQYDAFKAPLEICSTFDLATDAKRIPDLTGAKIDTVVSVKLSGCSIQYLASVVTLDNGTKIIIESKAPLKVKKVKVVTDRIVAGSGTRSSGNKAGLKVEKDLVQTDSDDLPEGKPSNPDGKIKVGW